MNPKAPKIAGVLPVIKPAGPTSHDVVQIARRALKERAIGHTGTLDPAADGLLLLCVGPYTKLVPYLTQAGKTYRGQIGLGLQTTTDDKEGAPVLSGDTSHLTEDHIRNLAMRFIGEIEQMPPRYAAVKVAGKKLYEYARDNEEVEVDPRPVTVYSFEISNLRMADAPADILARDPEFDGPKQIALVDFEVKVSSGTYVRSLARDLGRELGCGGYLASLNRSAVGRFTIDQAISTEELRSNPEAAEAVMLRGAAAMDAERYPIFTLLKSYEERLFRGQPMINQMLANPADVAGLPDDSTVCLASEDGALLAMVQVERFESEELAKMYNSRHLARLNSLRVFPKGLR